MALVFGNCFFFWFYKAVELLHQDIIFKDVTSILMSIRHTGLDPIKWFHAPQCSLTPCPGALEPDRKCPPLVETIIPSLQTPGQTEGDVSEDNAPSPEPRCSSPKGPATKTADAVCGFGLGKGSLTGRAEEIPDPAQRGGCRGVGDSDGIVRGGWLGGPPVTGYGSPGRHWGELGWGVGAPACACLGRGKMGGPSVVAWSGLVVEERVARRAEACRVLEGRYCRIRQRS